MDTERSSHGLDKNFAYAGMYNGLCSLVWIVGNKAVGDKVSAGKGLLSGYGITRVAFRGIGWRYRSVTGTNIYSSTENYKF